MIERRRQGDAIDRARQGWRCSAELRARPRRRPRPAARGGDLLFRELDSVCRRRAHRLPPAVRDWRTASPSRPDRAPRRRWSTARACSANRSAAWSRSMRASTSAAAAEIMDAIDALRGPRPPAGDAGGPTEAAIRKLESRLEDISARLDASASQFAGIDPDLIRSLETQVSGLSAHLSRPGAALPEFEDIGPRLDEIERSIAGSRDTHPRSRPPGRRERRRARFAGSQRTMPRGRRAGGGSEGAGTLTRRSDERNTKTFEAIHDTLLKIVDRLGTLERRRPTQARRDGATSRGAGRDAAAARWPSRTRPRSSRTDRADRGRCRRRSPQAPSPRAAAAPRRRRAQPRRRRCRRRRPRWTGRRSPRKSRRGPRALDARRPGARLRRQEGRARHAGDLARPPRPPRPLAAAPSVDLDEPLDPKIANRPLEPGSGAPDLNAIIKRVRDERGQPVKQSDTDAAKSDFIAAARRAAQAAAAEAEVLKRGSDINGRSRRCAWPTS